MPIVALANHDSECSVERTPELAELYGARCGSSLVVGHTDHAWVKRSFGSSRTHARGGTQSTAGDSARGMDGRGVRVRYNLALRNMPLLLYRDCREVLLEEWISVDHSGS